jgi:hypothetical protein
VNERTTEDIVREHLKRHAAPGQRVDEQITTVPLIRRALSAASKSEQECPAAAAVLGQQRHHGDRGADPPFPGEVALDPQRRRENL